MSEAVEKKKGYFSEYNKLPKLPKFFWVVIIYNFIDILAYTFVSNTYFPFFTKNVGFSGTDAGTWFFIIGFFITGFVLIGGVLVDRFGPKKIYVIKITLAAICRILATMFQDNQALAMIFHGLSFCMVSMGYVVTPMLLKRYSNTKTIKLVFNFQYFSMNFAFFCGGFLYDYIRDWGTESLGTLEDGLSMCMYGSAGFYMIAALVMLIFINDKKTITDDYKTVKYVPEISEKEQKHVFHYFRMTFFEKAFWLFVAVMVIAAMAKFIFTIPHLTLPNFMYNIIGHDAMVGKIGSINPFLIFMGLFTLTPILVKIKTPNALFVGTLISGGSLAFYLIPGIWVGDTVNSILGTNYNAVALGYYMLIVLQMIFYSTGEIMWSPRLAAFAMEIAPRGKEGIYSSLVIIPLMVSKFFLPLNGWVLDTYCPNTGTLPKVLGGMSYFDSPAMIFVIFLGILLITPFCVFLFRGYINERLAEADERHKKALEEAEREEEEKNKAAKENNGESKSKEEAK